MKIEKVDMPPWSLSTTAADTMKGDVRRVRGCCKKQDQQDNPVSRAPKVQCTEHNTCTVSDLATRYLILEYLILFACTVKTVLQYIVQQDSLPSPKVVLHLLLNTTVQYEENKRTNSKYRYCTVRST